MPYRLLWIPLCFLGFCLPVPLFAACGDGLETVYQELAAEEQAIRASVQTVNASRVEFASREAALNVALANPASDYDRVLARRLRQLHEAEVEPKRQIIERLRVQHEESRRQWERGRRLLPPQLAEAQAAVQAQTMSREQYCSVRDAYLHALRMYLQGMQGYRAGMELYAKALDAYGQRFQLPYTQGFSDRQQWEMLLKQLERRDFLQDILVPMTANAYRSTPPDVPPEDDKTQQAATSGETKPQP